MHADKNGFGLKLKQYNCLGSKYVCETRLCIHVCVYMHVCMCIFMSVYVGVWKERERELSLYTNIIGTQLNSQMLHGHSRIINSNVWEAVTGCHKLRGKSFIQTPGERTVLSRCGPAIIHIG